MKNIYKYSLLIVFAFIAITSCKLEEDSPYLQKEDVLTTKGGAMEALNGVLSAMGGYNYYGGDFHHLTDFTSGFFISGKPFDRQNVAKLSPLPSQNYPTNVWKQMYVTIGRANFIIDGIDENNPDPYYKNILGTAYFLRAHTYFHLVRLYGGVPLRTKPTTPDDVNLPRASVQDVYDLIISDANKAKNLMTNDVSNNGYPGKLAANMLLAKVYMQLAGNNPGSDPNWQKAYDEAIAVYGQYTLVNNYGDLWMDPSDADNTSESIFEIQYNIEYSSKLMKLFTPKTAFAGKGWQRIRPNPETIDDHMAAYADDPRIDYTFISKFIKYNNNGQPTNNYIKVYPQVGRGNFGKAYPYLYKYFVKDPSQTTDVTDFNYVVYRYADLLLMLAEIENELNGPANAYQYVNEVLARARNTASPAAVEPADWSGLSQDDFREKIMKEYQFELLGEGHDWFNNHRRGFNWFKTHVIDNHNNYPGFKPFDLTYPNDQRVMLEPIPSLEINTNENISAADQNPGY